MPGATRVSGVTSLVLAALVGLMVGCVGTSAAPSSASLETAAPTGVTAFHPDPATLGPTPAATADVIFSGRIQVDSDREVKVRCVGHGTPTVLLEGGGISPSLWDFPVEWVDGIGQETTVCHYSRAGGDGSTPAYGPRTMASVVSDAYRLLDTLREQAAVEPPYLFVGWSFGGSVALAEALERPADAAGLVILDTDFPADFMFECLGIGRTASDCQAALEGDSEAKNMEAEVVAKLHPLPETLQVTIVSAMNLPDCVVEPGATISAGYKASVVTAGSCDELAEKFADNEFRDWGQVQPSLSQVRLRATHGTLLVDAGDQIAQLIVYMARGIRDNR